MAAQLNPLYALQELVGKYLSGQVKTNASQPIPQSEDPGWDIEAAGEEIKQEGEALVEDYKPDLAQLESQSRAVTGETIGDITTAPQIVAAAEGALTEEEPVGALPVGEEEEVEEASEEEVQGALETLESSDADESAVKSAKEILLEEINRTRSALTPRKMTLLDIFGGGGGKSGRVFAEAGKRISEFKTEEQERQDTRRKEMLNLLLKQAQLESMDERAKATASARRAGAPNIADIAVMRSRVEAGNATPQETAIVDEYDRRFGKTPSEPRGNITDREAAALRLKVNAGTATEEEQALLKEYDSRKSSLTELLLGLGGNR
jgi:hypothetical protein